MHYHLIYCPAFQTRGKRLYGPRRFLASFRINFQAPLFLPILLQPLTPIYVRSFSHKRLWIQ